MTTLIHADIFFFVTTIVVAAIAVVIIIFLVYAILSARTLLRISKSIEAETDKVIGDVEHLRAGLKKRGAGARATWAASKRFLRKLFRLGTPSS